MQHDPQSYTPRAMLERLIAFDTTSSKSNLPLIDFVRGYLEQHGIDSFVQLDAAGTKANLHARIGPADRPGVGLSAHTDVVPTDGQSWASDPFRLTERDGKLFGRGTCDMKGFLAVCLALVPEMVRAALHTPIEFFLTHDEEVDCSGAAQLSAAIGREIAPPRIVIVGEPTMMRVVDAHKSAQEFFTEVTGHEAHSAMIHMGANAIGAAAKIVCEIDRLRDEMIARGDPSGRFTPPYSTIHVATIAGGTAINIVPGHCSIHWEMRGLPGTDPLEPKRRIDAFAAKHILPGLRAVSQDTDVVTRTGVYVPGFASPPGSPAEQLAKRLARQNTTEAVSYITEAGYYDSAGTSAIVCGPGSIEQAHKADEFITLAQLDDCTSFVRRLIDELST